LAVDQLSPNMPCIDEARRPMQNLRIIIEQLRGYVPLSGEGSPEGAVSSNKLRLYMDDLTGDVYIKKLDAIGGDKTQGWVLV